MIKASIYWFSGTGNSKRVVDWLKNIFVDRNITVDDIPIHSINRNDPIKNENSLIVFCSPTHGFNFPPLVQKFIWRFPKNTSNNKVLLINTRAGLRIGKVFLPGASGMALLFSALVLLLKGYSIVGMRSVDLPSNWLSLHPAVREKGVLSMHKHCETKVKDFAKIIANGGKTFKALQSFPFDLLFAPLALAYYLVGRFVFAKSFIATNACDYCGICIKSCPVKAIKDIKKHPYWTYKCESCMHCMNVCPRNAIETAHGFIGAVIFMSNVLISSLMLWLVKGLGLSRLQPILDNWLGNLIIYSVFFLFVLFAAYRIIYSLRVFGIIDRLLKYTSLTYYKFWGRYHPKKVIRKHS